jgi:hypothetical protein
MVSNAITIFVVPPAARTHVLPDQERGQSSGDVPEDGDEVERQKERERATAVRLVCHAAVIDCRGWQR